MTNPLERITNGGFPNDGDMGYAEYARLPVAIRTSLTLREWLWLPDSEKARVITNETEPDYGET